VTGFRFVSEHQADYPITALCRVAGVSRSSFYAWSTRAPSPRAQADAVLLEGIREIHTQSRCTYGAPRIAGQLRRRGIRVSRHRVARLMRTYGLVGVHGRRKWRRGNDHIVPSPDLLERDFTAPTSDLRWVADITQFRCLDGRLYLAGIRDLHDRSIVGWSMGQRQTTDLVVAALVMALGRRQPAGELVHHADHGCQYTSVEFTNHLADWGPFTLDRMSGGRLQFAVGLGSIPAEYSSFGEPDTAQARANWLDEALSIQERSQRSSTTCRPTAPPSRASMW
jgi:putative transposase